MPSRTARLTSSDIARFRELNELFASAFDDPASYRAAPPRDPYVTRLLAKEDVIALVALDGERVVGGLVAYVLDKFERERREIYIYDLAVDGAYRRRGIATALIQHLRRLAIELGAWVIFVQADYGDDPAISLYEKLGTGEEVLHYDIAPMDRS